MSKKWFFVVALFVCGAMQAQNQLSVYLNYIDAWKETAVANQKDYGIPASIIMAQALLESAAGQRPLTHAITSVSSVPAIGLEASITMMMIAKENVSVNTEMRPSLSKTTRSSLSVPVIPLVSR